MTISVSRWTAAACVLAGLAVPGAWAGGERPARPTCDGKPATIVGQRADARLVGTEGADVIVSRGGSVDARGGNDTICVTGPAHVEAGRGNDRVLVTTGRGLRSYILLGSGRDVLHGGAGRETVVVDGGDVARTGGGDDTVIHYGEEAFRGRVDLGRGGDRFSAAPYSEIKPVAEVVGGPGRDQLELVELGDEGGSVEVLIDTRRRLARQLPDGPSLRSWSSFEVFRPVPGSGEDDDLHFDLRFVGSGAGEVLIASFADRVRASMGGGVDRLVSGDLVDGSAYVGGGQSGDALVISDFSGNPLMVDLEAGEATSTGLVPTTVRAAVRGFTTVGVRANDVELIGTARPERLKATACDADILGGAGDDRLDFDGSGDCLLADASPTLRGGAGDDTLVGSSRTDDTLVGGAGRDSGDGRGGTDSCDVERARRCES